MFARVMSSLVKWSNTSRIDTHIHVIPPSYLKAINDNGGDPSGWATPSWTLEECIRFCDTIGSSFAVLSITAPGPAILGPTQAGRDLTRVVNDEVWDLCQRRPNRFGYFASLPDFRDVEGAVAEIESIFVHKQHANGVIVMSSYGDKLVGDESFKPIWEALDRHKALVFLHPGHVSITPEYISGFLPQPVIDYPQATTRAALSLVFSGIMTQCSGIDVILSHGGGILPYLAYRAMGSLFTPEIAAKSPVNSLQAKNAISRFYYDLALATSTPQLKALEAFSTPEKILYGSDFPYAPTAGIYAGLLQYAKYVRYEKDCKVGPAQLNKNTFALLSKHKQNNSNLPPADADAGQMTYEFGKDSSQDAADAMKELET